MALWTRLLETKAARPAEINDATARSLAAGSRAGLGHSVALSQDNVTAVIEGHYKRVLWVFRCVDAIAMAECSLPIYAWKNHDDDADRVDGWDHIEALFNGPDKPNKTEEYWQLRYRISTLLLLSQVGVFIEVVRDPVTGDPAQLTILDSDAVEVLPDARDGVKAYRVRYAKPVGRDGQTRVEHKDLDPERVLWLRTRPHPGDPYKQVTPLQAAGLSADTDFLARIFNRNWLSNDGRVAQLIAVKAESQGGLNPEDADKVKQMFGGGVARAGETRVVEADQVSVAQVGGSPADAQYTNLLDGTRQDIMMAFGVSESFLAWAAGRTFDNSDNEIEVVWQNTMRWHCKALASGFMPLIRNKRGGQAAILAHDFARVPQLQRANRLKADKALAEFQAGLISMDEYREATGKEPWKVAGTQVVWTPAGPVGPDDKVTAAAQELVAANRPPTPELMPGMEGEEGAAPPAGGGAQTLGGGAPLPALPALPALPGGGGSTGPGSKPRMASQADLDVLAGKLRSVVNDRSAEGQRIAGRSAITTARKTLDAPLERKAAPRPRARRTAATRRPSGPVVDGEVVGEVVHHDEHPTEARVKALDDALVRAGRGVCRDMLDAITDRLSLKKTRERTRHWTPALGTEVKVDRQLREWHIVQVDRWGDELAARAGFLIRDAASGAMADLRPYLGLDAPALMLASRLVRQMVNRLVDDLRAGIRRRTRDIAAMIRRMDDAGASIDDIKRAVADRQNALDQWVARVAPRVARAAVQGARKHMMDRVPDEVGVSVWRSQDDARVRPTHVEAHGQVAKRGHAFVIGGVRMMFPGDPRGPAREWANCRCYLAFRTADGVER